MSYDDSETYNSTKSLTAMFKVACATKGVNIMPPLSYYDVRRLIDIDDEEVTAAEDADELGEPLVEAAESLAHEERVGNSQVTVEPVQSLALLFDSSEAKSLKPRLLVALDTRRWTWQNELSWVLFGVVKKRE